MTPAAPAAGTVKVPAPPKKLVLPFPLTDAELADLAKDVGGMLSDEADFEQQVATGLAVSEGGVKQAAAERGVTLQDAKEQLNTLVRAKGLHPLANPEDFAPILAKMLAESPPFKQALPSLLKSLLVTGGVGALVLAALTTADSRYKGLDKPEEIVAKALQLHPHPDVTDPMTLLDLSVREALLDLWPAVSKLKDDVKSLLLAMLIGLAGMKGESGDKVRDLMADMLRRLGFMQMTRAMRESTIYTLQELAKTIAQWMAERDEAKAKGLKWIPPVLRDPHDGTWAIAEGPRTEQATGAKP